MADIVDIINASPDIFDNWTRHLRCIANADQCQAVSVTVFEASRSPQAFRDAFVCFELPEVGAKMVRWPTICSVLARWGCFHFYSISLVNSLMHAYVERDSGIFPHMHTCMSKILQKSFKNASKSSPKWSKIEVWRRPGRLLEPIGASWSCLGAS